MITNARGVFSRPIAEYVLMMILAVSRRLPGLLELQRERTWQPLEGVELRDVTVGIVGPRIDRAGGRGAGDRVRLPGRGGPPAHGRRRAAAIVADDETRSFGEVMLDRVGGPEIAPQLLAGVRFRRPRRAADARDRGHDRRGRPRR